jgi:hypothetical protein
VDEVFSAWSADVVHVSPMDRRSARDTGRSGWRQPEPPGFSRWECQLWLSRRFLQAAIHHASEHRCDLLSSEGAIGLQAAVDWMFLLTVEWFGLPEVGLGVLPGTGGTQRMARALPKNKAIELMAEAKLLSFEEALDLGLINYIFEADTYWDQVMAYARSFTPPNRASQTVGRLKRAVQSGAEIAFSEALALERELQQLCFQSEDAKEGISAYIEKRQPSFHSR